VPGVYELDVFPPPLGDATATVSAELAPVSLVESSDGLEVANMGARTVTGRMSMALLGAGRDFEIAGRGAVAETLTVRVPDWAVGVVIDVTMPRTQWDEFTGFAMTEFDSSGQQVGQNSLNYAGSCCRVSSRWVMGRTCRSWPVAGCGSICPRSRNSPCRPSLRRSLKSESGHPAPRALSPCAVFSGRVADGGTGADSYRRGPGVLG